MITFKSFFEDSANAYVFDVDMTLVNSNSRIWIYKNNLKDHSITAKEFTSYKLKADEELKNPESFLEFDVIDLDKAKPINYAGNILKSIFKKYKDKNEDPPVYILTARRSHARESIIKAIEKFFNGTVKPENVFTVGDDTDKADVPTLKKQVLTKLREKHHGHVEFWDDDHENIRLARTVMVGDKMVKARLAKSDFH